MELPNLYSLLKVSAEKHVNTGVLFYFPGKVDEVGKELKYHDLFDRAKKNARFIHELGLKPDSVVLLHFNNHVDNVEWFWSVVCAGYIPAMSTPFTNNIDQRKKHITHLVSILDDPLCLTTKELLSEFKSQSTLRLLTINDIQSLRPVSKGLEDSHDINSSFELGAFKTPESLAALMLTSGSSGNAKAVCLTHKQIFHAVAGKSKEYGTNGAPFLNWIGFDHVACLTETHLQAMYTGANQIMVQAEDLVPNPLLFLKLVSKHRVAASFAPNFFLASLRRALELSDTDTKKLMSSLDISCLQCIVSGGEANVVETCVALTNLLAAYNAPSNLIRPTFGMTESCAGAIYSKDCPRRDIECNNEFATVGSCIEGIEMRITNSEGQDIGWNVTGNLEISGPIVFSKYYNNPKATQESFNGKWFITGDRGLIDSLGQLYLTGRSKETVIINGVNYFPQEIEAVLENIPGAKPSYTVVFPFRYPGAQTESLCVVYYPTYPSDDIDSIVATNDSISRSVLLQTGVRPYIIPLDGSVLQKSTLGKFSRAKIRASFENGEYEAYQKFHDSVLAQDRAAKHEPPANTVEGLILKAFQEVFHIPEDSLGVNTDMFSMGIDSIGLIKLKIRLQNDFNIVNIPVITIMTHSTIRELAVALNDFGESRVYNPIVTLKSKGNLQPLFLVHPGAGEVLTFLKLASYFDDRPIYAMRARGFEDGEMPFDNIEEVLEIYFAKIKQYQPTGPYAIAGYSFGSMIAFELAKRLIANKDEVRFLGVFNLPPHIKFRMRELDWTNCVLQLSYFLKLFSEEYAHSKYAELSKVSKDEVLQHILQVGESGRMVELGLDGPKLGNWADVAYSLQAAAVDYEPSGMVESMDIFCAIPLTEVAENMEDWKANHLSKWVEFSKTAPKFHDVDGSHYTMIAQENVYTFQKRLKAALINRGI